MLFKIESFTVDASYMNLNGCSFKSKRKFMRLSRSVYRIFQYIESFLVIYFIEATQE